MTQKKHPFISYFSLIRFLFAAGLNFIAFTSQASILTAIIPVTPAIRSIFGQLRQIPEPDRLDKAYVLYRLNFRHVPLRVATANLDSLSNLANDLDDKSLQCAVYDMRADYLSVNTHFNKVSTDYYQKAIDFAKTNNLYIETGIAQNNKGVYYFIYKHYTEACACFLESLETFKNIGYDKVPKISVYLMHAVDFYYALGDYDNVIENLRDALKNTPDAGRVKINIINTIGLVYRNNKQYLQAVDYFNQAVQIAEATKDTIWVGIAKGNIGSVYFLQGNYSRALPYIISDYKTSLKYNEPSNAALALLRLAKIDVDEKAFTSGQKKLDTIRVLLTHSNDDVLNSWANYYKQQSELCEQLKNPAESLYYLKLFEKDKDSLTKRNDLSAVERVKLRYETDKHNAELTRARANEKVKTIRINAVIAVLILLTIITFLLYNRQRLARIKDKEILVAEKKVVNEQLRSAVNALRGFTENLQQKNILIEKFKIEIDHLNKQSAGNANAGNLEKLLHAHIMTDQNWNDFKKLFSEVYPGFFVNLNKNHPQLSAGDIRLLALMKLGLNNSDMANMLGITVEGIKKAKQRLRKKIDLQGLNNPDALDDF